MGAGEAGAGMRGRSRKAEQGGPRLRRMYVDCRYGQLHLLTAIPPSGGFDERTPLVCLHDSGGTGADFRSLAEVLGSDRPVYAPDLPGSGASDAAGGAVTDAVLAAAVVDLLDELRLRQVDMLGQGRGERVARELTRARPGLVRRVVAVGAAPDAGPIRAALDRPGSGGL